MKQTIRLAFCLCSLAPTGLFSQDPAAATIWSDPDFVARFTGSFLPITEQEPKITESEADLFKELAALLAANQQTQAIEILSRKVTAAADPKEVNAAINYTLANLYLQAGRYMEAAAQYEAAIGKFPNFRRAHKNLGLARIQSADYAGAVKALVKAVELGDGAGDTFGLLAYGYLNSGNPAAALEGYRQATLLNPTNREWHIGKAEAMLRTERYAEAIAEFKQLIVELPDRPAFYTSIANAYLSLGDPDQAANYLEMLRRMGQAKSSALGLLGDIYINKDLPELALAAYRDAVKAGDFPIDRRIRTFRAFLQRGHYPQAEAFLGDIDSGISAVTDAQARELLNLRAQLALAKGEDQKAADLLEQVLTQDPLNGRTLMLLGDFHNKKSDLEQAARYFERALAVPEFKRSAQLQLARIHVQLKEYPKAIEQLEGALAIEYSANVQEFLDAVKAAHNRSF